MRFLSALVLAAALCGCTAFPPRSDDRFAQVTPGMTREDARRIVGAPDETMKFPMTRTESWDYYYNDPWGFMCRYSIVFGPDGGVVTKVSFRLNDGGDHGT